MKLWQKVFLGTLILFEVVFNAASFYLIESNFNQNLKKEIDRGLAEQQIIYSGMKTNYDYVDYVNSKLGLPEDFILNFLQNTSKEYTQYFDKKNSFIEILDNNNTSIFSNFNESIDVPREELLTPLSEGRKYIIRDVGGKTYLFVTSQIVFNSSPFKLSYIRDISDVYTDRSSQFNLFIKMNIFITLILGIGLYLLIRYLTRSISNLTKSTQTIAGGNYSQRAKILSKDEIGELAQNFNQMASAVEDKVEQLKRTAESKQNFIECLTHELKTPLTSIIGYADLLRSTKYKEEIFFNALNYIYSEGKRLENLSFTLMDLILIQKEKPVMKNENILQLCREVEEILKPRLLEADIRMIVDVIPQKVTVEKDLFKMMCTNLLDNAIKASTAGGCIYLKGYLNKDSHFVLEVVDEGIGIAEDDVYKIFEPFYMVDKARSRSKHGAGLGLSICAEIVRLHEAAININSRLNEGTKVKVIFPQVLQLTYN